MTIEFISIPEADKRAVPTEFTFGKTFTNYMFSQSYVEGEGWHDAKIHQYAPFQMWPASVVLHYAQEFFEGAKAYRRPDGNINLFRFMDNCRRFNSSAERMAMPTVDPETHFDTLVKLLEVQPEWVPDAPSTLYIRPTMIANSQMLGLGSAREYLHYIILSPVGSYFAAGGTTKGLAVYVETEHVRAFPGGTGAVKAGGNYAASVYVSEQVKKQGYAQVLWLDGLERRYIEEVGAMNIAFVYNGKTIVTPELSGTILPGITRDSLLTLAPDLGYKMTEARLDVDEIMRDIASGEITEAFGIGTAAVIAAVGRFNYKGNDYTLGDQTSGPVSNHLRETLTGIQFGTIADPYGWTTTINVTGA